MASLSSAGMNALTPFLKASELFDKGIVFNITGAKYRDSNLNEDGQVAFHIDYFEFPADELTEFLEDEKYIHNEVLNPVLVEGLLTLSMTEQRADFIRYFDDGGEPILNVALDKGKKAIKGNKPFIFVDVSDDAVESEDE